MKGSVATTPPRDKKSQKKKNSFKSGAFEIPFQWKFSYSRLLSAVLSRALDAVDTPFFLCDFIVIKFCNRNECYGIGRGILMQVDWIVHLEKWIKQKMNK